MENLNAATAENPQRTDVIVQNGNDHVHCIQTVETTSPATYTKLAEGDLDIQEVVTNRPVVLRHGKYNKRGVGMRPSIDGGEHNPMRIGENSLICVTIQREMGLDGIISPVYD